MILDQEISSEQLAAIADGVISDEEYETGYRRYVACMEAEGYRVTDLGRSRNVIEYVIPEGAADADARCYPTEFLDIDRLWQMAHIDDSESADWLRACLEGHGHEPAETYAEMSAQLLESGLTPGDC